MVDGSLGVVVELSQLLLYFFDALGLLLESRHVSLQERNFLEEDHDQYGDKEASSKKTHRKNP